MGDFFNRHSYIIIWISALIIIGAAAIGIFELNGYIPTIGGLAVKTGGSTATPAPVTPAAPSVTFTVEKSQSGNSFYVQWQNLPDGTTALKIFRGKTGTPESMWLLWKTVPITPGELTNGSGRIDLGNMNEDGYSFYTEAVGGGGGGDNSSSTIVWISSSTTPLITTSTPPGPPPPPPPPNDQNPPSGGTPSSTSNNPPNNPPGNSSSGNGTPQTPTGTPYYNPQVQISSYGSAPTGNFWVQQVDQKIQIGWQDLPSGTTDIVIIRSQDQDGPWATVLTQKNSGSTGSYSIQIVDDTFGVPFYYELNAMDGTSTIATYGPVYLAGS